MTSKNEIAAGRKGSTSQRPSFFPRLSLFQWFIRFLPAIIFAFYTYSRKGAFQPPTCIAFGLNCPQGSVYLEGILERPDYYSQVLKYYLSLFSNSEDLGGSFAVFVEGKPVIDVYAGAKDLAKTQIYNNKTLQQVYSSGKVVEGIVIARLVDQGLLDYEKRVADYWPEFAQNDKEDVRLVDLMTHESGVSYLDDDDETNLMSWARLKDVESFSQRLARQPHHFKGEKIRAYHGMTRGWFLNEIVRRVDPKGRTIGQIAEQDLMGAYPDVELYYSKLPKESDWEDRLSVWHDYPLLRTIGRLLIPRFIQTNKYIGYPSMAPIHPVAKALAVGGKDLVKKSFMPKFASSPDLMRTKEAHESESPSFSLKTNAHSLARLMSMMANKGASVNPGQEPDLLSQETYTKATTFHSSQLDQILDETLPMSVGGWVKLKGFSGSKLLKDIEIQGWSGAGGSLTIWIEELHIGFSFVTNAFGPFEGILGDYRGANLLDRVVYARKQELGLLQDASKE